MNRITMYNKSRIEYIDIAKGIGILLMVIGHMVSIFPIRQFIFQFHMPMFLIFSGFLFNDKKWGGENVHVILTNKIQTASCSLCLFFHYNIGCVSFTKTRF